VSTLTILGTANGVRHGANVALTVKPEVIVGVTSDFAVTYTANAAAWSVQDDLEVGNTLYGDRTFTIAGLPTAPPGSQWIRAAHVSKTNTSYPLVALSLIRDATVYIGVPTRVGKPPFMDASWVDTSTRGTDAEGRNTRRFEVYESCSRPARSRWERTRTPRTAAACTSSWSASRRRAARRDARATGDCAEPPFGHHRCVAGLPSFELEPPPRYVAFVARNLVPVRDEATRIVGDEETADRLYPDALIDVAMRWDWLELQRRRLGRPDAAEEYLHRALARRCLSGQALWTEEPADAVDIRVLAPDEPPPRWIGRSASAAVRLAPQLTPTRPELLPVADAAIAWWHAYEKRRWRRWVAVLIAVGLLAVLIARQWQG
jgi:hypothetical protein